MQTVTVQVASVTWPKPGKKNGTIKDVNGVLYSTPPQFLQNVQQGVMYAISYKQNQFQGQTFNMVETIAPVQGGMMPQPQPQTQAAPPAQYVPPQQQQPHQQGKPAGHYAAISDRERAEQIFVCGALNNMLSNPTRDPFAISGTELTATVNMLRKVYANTFGGVQRNDEMADEIPTSFT